MQKLLLLQMYITTKEINYAEKVVQAVTVLTIVTQKQASTLMQLKIS